LYLRSTNDKLQPNQPREVTMGLHRTAHYLQSKGRGNDTMLVHMTPGEVKGLQALALRHGGSLTINPDTGLPEAGFLEQILPVVAAAGLTYLTAGAAAPTLTAALGGSTMAGGIAAGALSGAVISGGMAAIQGKDAGQAALMGGLGGGIAGGMGAYDAANVFNAPNLLADSSQQLVQVNPTDAATIMKEGVKVAPPPDVSNVYSGLAGQPTVPAGTMPTGLTAAPTPVPTQAGINASQLTGQARIDALNKLAEQTGTGVTSTAFGQAPGVNAEQALYSAENLARPTEVGNIYQPLTAKNTAVPTTFYQDQGTLGRMAIQGLPAIGLLGDTQAQVGPEDNYVSPLQRISPNFQAQAPVRPNPYYRSQYPIYGAKGGIMQSYQTGGPVERMSMANTAMNPQGGLYPQGMIDKTQYATPIQRPVSAEMVMETPAYERSNPMLMAAGGATRLPKGDPGLYRDTDPTTRNQDAFTAAMTRLNAMQKKANIKGLPVLKAAAQPLGNIEEAAKGGIMSSLGGYSDGGRMLKGPGDGMSDSIPATIGGKQPARLADGEFVVPADVVSHLGNGSTDAGAKKLYSMMDKIRKARTGKKRQAPAVKADRYMPA
jgi:hypothetical protein